MINETDSKMSMISVYVDQLEERLASFAVARRDINVREEACKAIEEEQGKLSKECEELKKEKNILTEARDELQGLVDVMVKERAQLKSEKAQLEKERDLTISQVEALQEELKALNENFMTLDGETKEAKESLEKASSELSGKDADISELKQLFDDSNAQLEAQKESLQKSTLFSMNLQGEVDKLENEKETLAARIAELEETVDIIRLEAEEKFENQVLVEADKLAEEKFAALKASLENEKASPSVGVDEENVNVEHEEPIIEDENPYVEIAQDESENETSCEEDSIEIEVCNIDDNTDSAATFDTEEDVSVDKETHGDTSDIPPPSSFLDEDLIEENEVSGELLDQNEETIPSTPPFEEQLEIEVTEFSTETSVEMLSSQIPPPPPPLPQPDIEELDEVSIDSVQLENDAMNLSGIARDNLSPPPPQPPMEVEINHARDDITADDTFNEDRNYLDNQPETIGHNTYYAQGQNGTYHVEENILPPPPPPPMIHPEEGEVQNQPSDDIDPSIDYPHQVYEEQLGDEVQIDGYTSETQRQELFEQYSIPSDHSGVNEPVELEVEGDDDDAQELVVESSNNDSIGDIQNVDVEADTFGSSESSVPRELYHSDDNKIETANAPLTTEDTPIEVLKEDDDFEIISDNEDERPAGYFEDHFDDVKDQEVEEETEVGGEGKPMEEGEKSRDEDEPTLPEVDEPTLPDDLTHEDSEIESKSIGEKKKRKVPFRRLRKTFAFVTGVHGAFTPSTKQLKIKGSS